jgi:hypothetical protein
MEEQEPVQDDFKSKRVVYAIPYMEEVSDQKDIVYKVVDENELKMDVYYPADSEGEARLPAVILVHGDGPPDYSSHTRIFEDSSSEVNLDDQYRLLSRCELL